MTDFVKKGHTSASTHAQSPIESQRRGSERSLWQLSYRCTHTRARMHARTHARTHTRTHAHTHTRTHAHTHTRTHAHSRDQAEKRFPRQKKARRRQPRGERFSSSPRRPRKRRSPLFTSVGLSLIEKSARPLPSPRPSPRRALDPPPPMFSSHWSRTRSRSLAPVQVNERAASETRALHVTTTMRRKEEKFFFSDML